MKLKPVQMGIDTHQEFVVYMHRDCPICRAEGFNASARIQVASDDRSLIATLNVIDNGLIDPGEIGFSNAAWERLRPGPDVHIEHAPVVSSMDAVRAKIFDHHLSDRQISSIVDDIGRGYYSDVQIAGFITACAGDRLVRDEITALTAAMVAVGERLSWDEPRVFDKHCIGGLPGNRTTPLVVSICSAAGLVIPKTSSRAITSPAGTADSMSTMTRVDLDLATMRRTVQTTGACLVWGGAMRLSPVDDQLIRIERSLDIDSEGQLIASVLSKKIAAGSTHVLIDLPVGPTAKVRSEDSADALTRLFEGVGTDLGLTVHCVVTDGSQPIGTGIGPALEARDVLTVLRNHRGAPVDLREKSLVLSAHLLSMASGDDHVSSLLQATKILESGRALEQFMRICEAQGGFTEPPVAPFRQQLPAQASGRIAGIDNRRIARLAKLAGCPEDLDAGVELHVRHNQSVESGEALLTLHAHSEGELEYALNYYRANRNLIAISEH